MELKFVANDKQFLQFHFQFNILPSNIILTFIIKWAKNTNIVYKFRVFRLWLVFNWNYTSMAMSVSIGNRQMADIQLVNHILQI